MLCVADVLCYYVFEFSSACKNSVFPFRILHIVPEGKLRWQELLYFLVFTLLITLQMFIKILNCWKKLPKMIIKKKKQYCQLDITSNISTMSIPSTSFFLSESNIINILFITSLTSILSASNYKIICYRQYHLLISIFLFFTNFITYQEFYLCTLLKLI